MPNVSRVYHDRQAPLRLARFAKLAARPDVHVVERADGWVGIRAEGRWVDFHPVTSRFVSDGKAGKGWVQLLRALGIKRGAWERSQPTDDS